MYHFLGQVQCFKLVKTRKSISCLCPKLVNSETGQTTNLKILYNKKTFYKEKELYFIICKCTFLKTKNCVKQKSAKINLSD